MPTTRRQIASACSISSRGRLLNDLIELLAGKKLPGKVKTFNSNKAIAVEQLLGQYASVLAFLKQHGALVNLVKPEALMDADNLRLLLNMREARAASQEHIDSLARWCALANSEVLFQKTNKNTHFSIL